MPVALIVGGMVFSPGILPQSPGKQTCCSNAQVQVWEIEASPSELQESRFDISWLMNLPPTSAAGLHSQECMAVFRCGKNQSVTWKFCQLAQPEVNSILSNHCVCIEYGIECSRHAVHHHHDATLSLQD